MLKITSGSLPFLRAISDRAGCAKLGNDAGMAEGEGARGGDINHKPGDSRGHPA